ncbi:MAG TPA: arylamine N-acetyltransferase [Terriglobales bacterium]|nr:arylamine N-acetyltransferase [Terriglobales bacterium]
MDVAAYLERIGYTGSVEPTADVLRQLQRAHLFSVPFENLDISRKREIVVDPARSVAKVVLQRRGGFCYELNGAFSWLLRSLGFQVTLLSARVPRQDGSEGPEFDHLALRVDVDQPWLADVGFGDSFLNPLKLDTGAEQQDENGRVFRILQEAGEVLEVQRREGDTWKTEYNFSLKARQLEEFAGMCRYHQTSFESPFTRKRVCSLATPDGRITLTDGRLIVTRGAERDEQPVASTAEWDELLKKYFGVVLG